MNAVTDIATGTGAPVSKEAVSGAASRTRNRYDVVGGHALSPPRRGSLARRMLLIAAGWITFLLLVGGFALDRTLTGLVERNFDDQLSYLLNTMIVVSEIGEDGEVRFNRQIGEPRFLEPNSGLYWQINAAGQENFPSLSLSPDPSRSLWDRTLKTRNGEFDAQPFFYDSDQFENEPLRMVERTVRLPDSDSGVDFRRGVVPRRVGFADRAHPFDPVLEFRGAGLRSSADGDVADMVRPWPIAPGARRHPAYANDRDQSADRTPAGRGAAAGR